MSDDDNYAGKIAKRYDIIPRSNRTPNLHNECPTSGQRVDMVRLDQRQRRGNIRCVPFGRIRHRYYVVPGGALLMRRRRRAKHRRQGIESSESDLLTPGKNANTINRAAIRCV